MVKTTKKKVALGVAGLVAAVAAVVVITQLSSGSDEEVVVHRLGERTPVMRTPKAKMRKKVRRDPIVRMDREKSRKILESYRINDDGSVDFGEFDQFKGGDNFLARTLDRAFWDDDKETVLSAVMDAAYSDNEELRKMAVEKAAWFGADGMDALTTFFSDKDESVAEAAREAWVNALGEVDDDETRVAMIEPLCRTVKDPVMADGMLMSLSSMANIAQMQVMISLMDIGSEEVAAAARDHYAFVTGEDFTTVEAAQKWLEENWEEDDEAFVNGESPEEFRDRQFKEEANADIDAAARELGVTSAQIEELMGDEADSLELSGEEFVQKLNRAAREAGLSTKDYIVKNLKGQVTSETKGDEAANEGDAPEN